MSHDFGESADGASPGGWRTGPARLIHHGSKRTAIVGIATTAVLSGAISRGVVGASAAPSAHRATVSTRHNKLGTFLVDGKTVYLFEKDKTSKSTCYGDCASDWPPLITKDAPKASGKVKASLLGETKRKGGKEQVTDNGHPLYYFAGDSKAGQTNGEGVDEHGTEWYVVNPKGKKIDND